MPLVPWRLIDWLLGRSRPGDEDRASEADVSAEVARSSERLDTDSSFTEHLDPEDALLVRSWARTMLQRRAPEPDDRSKRDLNVQLGAVSAAVRAVMRGIDEAFAVPSDVTGQRLAWRLRALESEIAAPLYTADEQAVARARLDELLRVLDSSQPGAAAPGVVAGVVDALTPRDN